MLLIALQEAGVVVGGGSQQDNEFISPDILIGSQLPRMVDSTFGMFGVVVGQLPG